MPTYKDWVYIVFYPVRDIIADEKLEPLSKEGFLSCHSGYEMEPQFTRSYPKDRLVRQVRVTEELSYLSSQGNPMYMYKEVYLHVSTVEAVSV